MPAVPSSIIDPIWHQFEALIPPVIDEHPLGCHRPRVPDRILFDKLGRFGFAGYDSDKTRELLETLGVNYIISKKGTPLQTGARWVVERTHSWHNRGFKKLAICTERRARVTDALIALANAIIITRRLIAQARSRYRWEDQPTRKP